MKEYFQNFGEILRPERKFLRLWAIFRQHYHTKNPFLPRICHGRRGLFLCFSHHPQTNPNEPKYSAKDQNATNQQRFSAARACLISNQYEPKVSEKAGKPPPPAQTRAHKVLPATRLRTTQLSIHTADHARTTIHAGHGRTACQKPTAPTEKTQASIPAHLSHAESLPHMPTTTDHQTPEPHEPCTPRITKPTGTEGQENSMAVLTHLHHYEKYIQLDLCA